MNKHKFTFDGHTFTRNSKSRTYSHAVVCLQTIADYRAQAVARARGDYETNVSFYREVADGTSRLLARKAWETEAQHAERVAHDRARAGAYVNGGVDAQVATVLKRVEESVAKSSITSDGEKIITVAGWCGRLDLAQKLASKDGGQVVAVEVAT